MLRVALASLRVQFQLLRQDFEDLQHLLSGWLLGLVMVAVIIQAGRTDLIGYAIAGRMLMNMGQMGFFVAGELIARERGNQTLELLVAAPAPMSLVFAARIAVISLVGLLGLVDSWIIARIIFDVPVRIHHPEILLATTVATLFAATGAALLTASLFSLAPSVRTYQNSFSYPLYVLAGVLVPVTFLPDWLEPLSRVIFLFWSANLVRDSLQPGAVGDYGWQLAAILGLGVAMGLLGAWVLRRMIDHLKTEGTLGLT
jgi:ABC-2 type transport system permease protein